MRKTESPNNNNTPSMATWNGGSVSRVPLVTLFRFVSICLHLPKELHFLQVLAQRRRSNWVRVTRVESRFQGNCIADSDYDLWAPPCPLIPICPQREGQGERKCNEGNLNF